MQKLIIYCFLLVTPLTLFAAAEQDTTNPVELVDEWPEESINRINIKLASEDLNLIVESRDTVEFRFYGDIGGDNIDPEDYIQYSVKNGTLKIERINTRKLYVFSYYDMKVDIIMPRKFFEKVDISLSSGNCHIEYINTDTAGISSSSGNLILNEGDVSDLSLTTSSGNITVSDLKSSSFTSASSSGDMNYTAVIADTFNWSNSSGTLRARALTTMRSKLRSSSGDVYAEDFTGHIERSSSSGGTVLTYSQYNQNNIYIDSTSGDIVLTLPADSEFQTKLTVTSGKIISDFSMTSEGDLSDRSFSGRVGSGEGFVELETTSGNISLRHP